MGRIAYAMSHRRRCPAASARRGLNSETETDKAYARMVALARADLAVEASWAPFGARLLKAPQDLPEPVRGEEDVCPLSLQKRGSSADALGASQESADEAAPNASSSAPSSRVASASARLVAKQQLLAKLTEADKELQAEKKLLDKQLRHNDFKASDSIPLRI